ncbi:MAG: ABC transporter substrate-binding protein, partial [SAR324 cluster bacterium]|nr:ABC transporter substrate-binding protein [SAR324 cluster bacterium]
MKKIIQRHTKLLLICGSAIIFSGSALAGKTHLTMGMVLEPPHLDPTAGAAAAIDEVVYANVFEGLTRINQNAEVLPALAKSWNISSDGLTYTFNLRNGVRFHDGSAFDSSDVVFSLDRARSENSTNAQKALFAAIEGVNAQGSNTVVVTLNTPTGNFLFNMGWGDAVIVDSTSANSNKSKPVGTGPFIFKRWVKGDRIELGQNTNYWGEKPALKSATFKIIPDPAAAVAALMAGDADAFANFPAPEMASQFQRDSRFTVKVGSTEGETILSTNNLQ